jgi:hypothetical protein
MFYGFLINGFLLSVIVLFHYEVLNQLSRLIPSLTIPPRLRVVVGVMGLILAHIAEIWIFGIAYYNMTLAEGLGGFQGNFDGTLLDCVYFSYTTYSTLGYGDIEPIGHLRFLAGTESVLGLILITWSASFMLIEMQKLWFRK